MMVEYVEREALIAKLKEKTINTETAFINCVLIGLLKNAPTADVVEVRHGEWRYEGDYKACSLCGTFVEWNTLGTSHWKYCPFCGAKMDGKGEGA